MEKKITSHILKGVILSVISILFSVTVYVFNLYESSIINYLSTAVILIGLIYGAILYSNQNNNQVTFGNLFAHCFKTTAVVIAITSVYTVLAFKFFFPDMLVKVLEISRKRMAENPKLTEEMVTSGMEMTKKYFIPFVLGGTIIGTGILGLIGSLIGAAVAKKNNNPFGNPA